MAPSPSGRLFVALLAAAFLALASSTVRADAPHERAPPLPSPLRLTDVLRLAAAQRAEIEAARARARAAGERPAIVSALEDPMVMASVDHLPFTFDGVDASLMVEQRFPLSRIRGHRKRAAEAGAIRFQAESDRVSQDVQLEAARAFLMLQERRAMARVLDEQVALARQLVAAANARYSSGSGNQPEVLRAEIEVARLDGTIRAIRAEVAAAEAMLNASLGRPADGEVPPLDATPVTSEPPPWTDVLDVTLRRRPELAGGRAEIGRANAEISEMKSMYWPMGLVRTGPAYSMADRWGWMLTLGVSIPLQRGRLKAGVREAEAMAAMARADLAAMSRMAEGEAATARYQVLAARERVLAFRDDVVPRARNAFEPSVAAYSAGTLPLVSVIDVARALWSVQAELVAADFELGLAWVRLQRAQGRLEIGGAQ